MRPHSLLWSPLDDYLAELLRAAPAIRVTPIRSAADLAVELPYAGG
jgi:hypothetical protein